MKIVYFNLFWIAVQSLPSDIYTQENSEEHTRTKRIAQGTLAFPGQFPYACHISWFWPHPSRRPSTPRPARSDDVNNNRAETFDSVFYQCSCAIIHERYVVTAANCFQPAIDYYNKTEKRTLEIDATNWPLFVRAGFVNVHVDDAGFQERNGVTVFVHHSYRNQTTMLDVDVAIVSLRFVFDVENAFQRVKIISIGKIAGSNKLNINCMGLGYGRNEHVDIPPNAKQPTLGESKKMIKHLRYFKGTAGRGRYCKFLQRKLSRDPVHFDSFYMCAISNSSSTYKQHNCDYDNGGPLVCDGALMGILAQRREKSPCDIVGNSFSMYTYLGAPEALGWIRDFIPDLRNVVEVTFDKELDSGRSETGDFLLDASPPGNGSSQIVSEDVSTTIGEI